MKYDVILLSSVTSRSQLQRSLGVYNVAHVFRHDLGLSTQVIDFTDWFEIEELYQTVKDFIGDNTQYIGVSSTFYQTELPDKDAYWENFKFGLPKNITFTLEKLKKEFPKIKFILGGANSYLHPQYPFFDAVFHAYSETSLKEYVKNTRIWKTENNKSVIEGDQFPVDIEKLTHHWEDNDFILPGETLPIEIGRGCIFKCKFCNYPLTGKKKLDYIRGANLIAQELQNNYDRYGVTNYFFTDDTFNDSTYKLEILKEAFDQLTFQPQFTSYIRQDLLYAHREQVDLLKDLGLRSAFFGIESLNPQTAKLVGKGMASDKVKDWLLELKHDHFKDKINFVCSMIIGLPEESLDSVNDSFNWTYENKINTIWAPLFLRPTARYKSEFDKNYEKYGYEMIESGKNIWQNKFTNFLEAAKLAQDYQYKALSISEIHTWVLFSLATLGIKTIDEAMHMKMSEGAKYRPLMMQRIIELISDYKKRLRSQ